MLFMTLKPIFRALQSGLAHCLITFYQILGKNLRRILSILVVTISQGFQPRSFRASYKPVAVLEQFDVLVATEDCIQHYIGEWQPPTTFVIMSLTTGKIRQTMMKDLKKSV
jgi:hypothetical protein